MVRTNRKVALRLNLWFSRAKGTLPPSISFPHNLNFLTLITYLVFIYLPSYYLTLCPSCLPLACLLAYLSLSRHLLPWVLSYQQWKIDSQFVQKRLLYYFASFTMSSIKPKISFFGGKTPSGQAFYGLRTTGGACTLPYSLHHSKVQYKYKVIRIEGNILLFRLVLNEA